MIPMADIRLTENEIDAAVNVLRSGALRQGVECDSFEREFAEYVGANYAVTCASGSAALQLPYLALIEPGDEVLVPSFTFIATGSMVSAVGGKPVFCDVDPHTFLIDLEDAETRITGRTKAIGPVHLFGNPCDVDAVEAFARRHNLKIVWDAAQAHGAKYAGRDVGSFGDFVTYSFYPSKNMFVGEGGMTCTNDGEMDHQMRFMRSHGQTGKYLHTMHGLNLRMTDVEAAIGREQLKRLPDIVEARTRNAELLNDGLADIPGIRTQAITDKGHSAWHQYCMVVDEEQFGIGRDTLIEKMRESGVSTGVHYPRGLHQQPIFVEAHGATQLPVTEQLANNIIALPVHQGLSKADVEQIVEAVRKAPSQNMTTA